MTTIWASGGAIGAFGILVHGGAGNVPVDRRSLHVAGCVHAAKLGARVLADGGAALDAVVAAVRALEDDPLFNAGTGASLNERGEVELDASLMEGTLLRAGGVCALRRFRDPIAIARAVLDDGRHVLYAADGARAFAIDRGFVEVDEATLITGAARSAFDAARLAGAASGFAGGTVGAVAIDKRSGTAAATSTGGLSNKRVGRVGDSPIVGAGTYADDAAGAVSTTGRGEGMMRLLTAKGAVERMRAEASAESAAREAVVELDARLEMTGGLIAIDRARRFGVSRSTPTMSFALVGDGVELAGIDEL